MQNSTLINEALVKQLTVKEFHTLLLKRYKFSALDALELSTLYRHRLNK